MQGKFPLYDQRNLGGTMKKPTCTLRCLKCNKEFQSKDKTRNRLCPFCNQDNQELSLQEEISTASPKVKHASTLPQDR